MPRLKALSLFQANTEQFTAAVSLNSAVYDLAGAAVECYIKPSAETADNDASVTVLTIGSGIEVLDAAAGQVRVTVPSGTLAVAGVLWWRLDVVKSGARRTAVRGPLYVLET